MQHNYIEDKAAGKITIGERKTDSAVEIQVSEQIERTEQIDVAELRGNIPKWQNMIKQAEAMIADAEKVPEIKEEVREA